MHLVGLSHRRARHHKVKVHKISIFVWIACLYVVFMWLCAMYGVKLRKPSQYLLSTDKRLRDRWKHIGHLLKVFFLNLNMLWWLPFTYNYLILFSTKSLHTLGAYHTPSATNLNFKSLKLGRHELVAANFRLQVLRVESLC